MITSCMMTIRGDQVAMRHVTISNYRRVFMKYSGKLFGKYSGKLYGKVAGHFIPLKATSEDVIIIGEPMKPQQVADLLNCYVSMDADGYWWWHILEPKIEESCWVDDGSWDEHESFGLIVPDLIDWEGDWKDSLHRPTRRS